MRGKALKSFQEPEAGEGEASGSKHQRQEEGGAGEVEKEGEEEEPDAKRRKGADKTAKKQPATKRKGKGGKKKGKARKADVPIKVVKLSSSAGIDEMIDKNFITYPSTQVIKLSSDNSASGSNLTRATHVVLFEPSGGSIEHAKAQVD